MAKFVEIDGLEMGMFLTSNGFEYYNPSTDVKLVSNPTYEDVYVKYLSENKDIAIIVYSSISKDTGMTRDKGSDAIREVLWSEMFGFSSMTFRTNRVGNSPDDVYRRILKNVNTLETYGKNIKYLISNQKVVSVLNDKSVLGTLLVINKIEELKNNSDKIMLTFMTNLKYALDNKLVMFIKYMHKSLYDKMADVTKIYSIEKINSDVVTYDTKIYRFILISEVEFNSVVIDNG